MSYGNEQLFYIIIDKSEDKLEILLCGCMPSPTSEVIVYIKTFFYYFGNWNLISLSLSPCGNWWKFPESTLEIPSSINLKLCEANVTLTFDVWPTKSIF